MASMSALKNAILSLSKSPEMAQSLPLRPGVSRVCFAAASRHQQGRNMAGEAGRKEYSPEEPRDEVRETMEKAKEKSREMNEKSKEKLGPVADKAYEMRDKTADKTKRQAHEASDKVRGAAEKAKGTAETAAETTKGAAEKVADAAKGAWGAAKDTTQKIKETVVGKSDGDDLDDYIEDHVKKPKLMDEEVVDERRRRVDDHNRDKL